jgi:phospholipase/lecithinase/hemolysin
MNVTAIVLVIGVTLVPIAHRAVAQPFSQVIVFGDSNVDSGYYKQLSAPGGGTTYDSLWPSAVSHGAGVPTTSPGLMSSQFLAAYFNLTANPANTAGGTNYATSGAKNETSNNASNGGFTAAIPTGTQIRNYVSAHGGMADSQALYLIWSGDNDVSYANGDTGTSPPSDPDGYVMEAAEDLNGDILFLKNAGAQHIIVAGLAYDYPTGNSTDAVNRRALKLLYTQTLFQNLTQIGVSYYPADIDKVRLAISADPANYGFTNIGTGAGQMGCAKPNGISSAWALLCSSDPNAPSTLVSPTAPLTDLFADDQHLGTAGQRLMANFLYRQVVPPTVTHNFNVDRTSDIVWRNINGDTSIWLMTTNQSGGAQIQSATDYGIVPTSWQIVGQRDFNDDGKADLLWSNSNGDTSIWLMNGTTVSSTSDLGIVGNGWAIVGTGDFNGDGYGDILWRNTNGDTSVWLMTGNATQVQVLSSTDLGSVPTGWSVAQTGDFNGDGKTDILWHNSNGDTSIWLMTSNGTQMQVLSTTDLGVVPTSWSIAGTGDFNGDGYADILWHNSNGNTSIWLMTSNGTQMQVLSTTGFGGVPTSWNIALTGDFNGDGKSDILWRNSNGDTSIWFMTVSGTHMQMLSASDLGGVPTSWLVQNTGAD